MDEQPSIFVSGHRQKTRIFISYSRTDSTFTRQLVDTLKSHEFEVYQDIEDILPSEAWRARIHNLIGQSDTVVVIISPDAISSKVCQWELQTAQGLNKRLVPVLYRDMPIAGIPEQLSQINFIFFNDATKFEGGFARLIAALETDIAWLREHTTIGELARRWDKLGRRTSMLLRGKNIKEAEAWLAQRPLHAPAVDDLQRLFIRTSRNSQRHRKQISIAGSLAALLAITSVPVVFYPNHTYVALNAMVALRKVDLVPPDRVPITEVSKVRLASTIQILANSLAKDAAVKLAKKDPTFNSWAVAQLTIAIKGLHHVSVPSVEDYLISQMNLECGCWLELSADKHPHTGASGWVLVAIGDYGAAAPNAALEYLMSLQNQDGWWPLYPATSEPFNASTYATAWALLGLSAHRDRVTDPALKAKIETAIVAGTQWLQRTRLKGKASWKDYPTGSEGRESIGVSGLALHVLHTLLPLEDIAVVEQEWLGRLPVDERNAETADMTNMTITLSSGSLEFDRTRNYRLPWALIASADAYPRGSAMQRARVVAWLELVLRSDLATEAVLRQNWVAAELLIALRHVERQLQ